MTTTQTHQAQIDEQETIWEVPDALWTRLEPLLIIDKPRKKSGRPSRDARSIFNGLIWLAR
ncbi:transposase, partial [Deinococcus detaillensis]